MAEGKNVTFDDGARDVLTLLLENYWVLREDQPEQYRLIRHYEQVLRPYLYEKCGWRLIQHPQFYKLEKIPSEPEGWMGIMEFQHPRDYVVLCLTMAVLEEKSVDDQFLLSDLCESILALHPSEEDGDERLSWENYEHRRSLVRVLKFAVEEGLVRLVDGDNDRFAMYQESEALYEVSVLARYFLRSYPKDLRQYQSMDDLKAVENFEEERNATIGRRARVYRHLLLSPAYNAEEARPEDLFYLRSMHKRLRDELESHTGLQFELYKDCAMLVSPERTNWCKQIFPAHQSGIHAAILHFSRLCRDERQADAGWQNQYSWLEFEKSVERCRNLYGAGWTKELREQSVSRLSANILAELTDWNMATRDQETGLIALSPAFWRLAGRYPDDYVIKN